MLLSDKIAAKSSQRRTVPQILGVVCCAALATAVFHKESATRCFVSHVVQVGRDLQARFYRRTCWCARTTAEVAGAWGRSSDKSSDRVLTGAGTGVVTRAVIEALAGVMTGVLTGAEALAGVLTGAGAGAGS